MTSPATNNTPATSTTSYASAAGAPKDKKPAQAPPVVATGSSPASTASSQNAKPASPSNLNGKPAIPSIAHSRHTSVTMATNGPNSFAANGGPVGGTKSGIQFGFDSPAMGHSTPQTGNSAPIPIPGGTGTQRVPSPAHSPSPIPQPSATGGRPPSSLQQPGNQMTFGSLGSDGDRHMRQGSVPTNPNALGAQQSGAHLRRESNHSIQSDNAGGHARGNFAPQANRGRGYNPHGNNYNNPMGYPPNNQFRNGPGQGRGMPPPFQPQRNSMGYPNSPQPTRGSPAMVSSIPNTPNMPPATMQANMPMATPPNYHYGPPMSAQHQQNYGFPPQQSDAYGRPVYGYNNMPYMQHNQTNSPGYQGYAQPYHQSGHSMSRTPSQPERPPSVNPQSPAVAMGSNSQQPSSSRSKASRAITIKAPDGTVVDTSTFAKAPASPAVSTHRTSTPPVVTSTPTPPPKSVTPAHTRTDSNAAAAKRSNKEIQDELREKIRLAAAAKDKEDKPTSPDTKDKVEAPAAEAKPEPTSAAPAEKTEAAPVPKIEETVKETSKETAKETAKEAEADKPASGLSEEEEMDRIIAEMEEEDRKREEAEKSHKVKADAEKAAAKEKADANGKLDAAEADKKLREQEREMERLEEEKEKKREQSESGGKTLSVAEALAAARGGAKDDSKADSVTDKLAGMTIGEKSSTTADAKPTTAEKRAKPAALNLAPLNTKSVEPPQPSAALQSLKSARFLSVMSQEIYPEGIKSPNPALNAAVAKKGTAFKYDAAFLLQFQKVYTEQPSLEFHQQVKTLIGDDSGRSASNRGAQTPGSARQGSRGGGAGFAMGAFNAPPGRTVPPGTTSAERFAMSSGSMPRPSTNPMASFGRPGGAFPTSSSMSRTSSQSAMGPNAGRQNSRSTRGSRRDGPKDAQAAKTMPLTAGQDLKPIAVTSSGWKPTSIGNKGGSAAPSGHMDPEMVQRKVKAALNKMTPENFEKISDQILVIASQSKDESDGRTLRQVIQLTFEKATDEAHWASMYARFCKKMLETMSAEIRDERIKDKNGNVVSGGNLFRKYLLNRCQEEFEQGWAPNLPEKPEEEASEKKTGEAVMLSDDYYIAAAAKRRGLGLVQFIGELYKLGMLTERIMMECVHKLVDYKGVPDEAEIESLSKLLRTIGAHLDMSEKGRPVMDVYFQRIQKMMDMPELASRMKYMLLDVIDLRKANWHSKETNKGPKTLDEVRVEAEAAQAAKAQEAARSNQRGGGRPGGGRGDARNFSAGYTQQPSNQVGMDDLRRLKGSANRAASGNITLGPSSMFSSRSNSGRRLGPGGSLGRPGEDSGASSRTGTPPTRENPSHSNAFSLLANMETEHPASPPSTSASPNMSKAVPDSDKKENE